MNTVAAVGAAGPAGARADAVDETALPIARRRHPWRWLVSAIALVPAAQFVHGLVTNPGWDWPTFVEYFTADAVLKALRVTVELTLYGTFFGFLLGIWLAIGRLSHNPVLQVLSWISIWAFRSIPLIVQLLFWFNLAYLYRTFSLGVPFGPGFVSFDVNGMISGCGAAVIGLALHQAAYAAEIIRAGIISADPGQVEAAKSLGLPWRRQFFTIVAPQAMRGIGFAKGSQRELPPTPLQRLRGKITEIIGKRR